MQIKNSGNKEYYKPLTINEDGTYLLMWHYQATDENSGTWIEDLYFEKPSLQTVQNTIIDSINADIDEKILSGFRWNEMDVWLSSENQFNYKAAFDLAVQTQGANLPLRFKFGTKLKPSYHTFNTVEELQKFYVDAMTYVNTCLEIGWKEKDSINWNEYNIDKILKGQQNTKKSEQESVNESEQEANNE